MGQNATIFKVTLEIADIDLLTNPLSCASRKSMTSFPVRDVMGISPGTRLPVLTSGAGRFLNWVPKKKAVLESKGPGEMMTASALSSASIGSA
jgi:hypothetical protein